MISYKAVFNSVAAGAALTSAALLFGAAKVRISVWGDAPDRVSDAQIAIDDIDFFATVAVQARWNKWAALAAGIAALEQALALILPA